MHIVSNCFSNIFLYDDFINGVLIFPTEKLNRVREITLVIKSVLRKGMKWDSKAKKLKF